MMTSLMDEEAAAQFTIVVTEDVCGLLAIQAHCKVNYGDFQTRPVQQDYPHDCA